MISHLHGQSQSCHPCERYQEEHLHHQTHNFCGRLPADAVMTDQQVNNCYKTTLVKALDFQSSQRGSFVSVHNFQSNEAGYLLTRE